VEVAVLLDRLAGADANADADGHVAGREPLPDGALGLVRRFDGGVGDGELRLP
jgi:hypothetical protein